MPRQPNPTREACDAERTSAFARSLPLWPGELEDRSPEGRLALLARLRRALRAERRRGVAGDWAYDLARHRALVALYRREAQEALLTLGEAREALAVGRRPPNAAKP